MDPEKMRRNQSGYLNENQVLEKDQEYEQKENLISIQQSFQSLQSFSQTKETSVLSIQQNNQIDINLQEIIALYQQIDNKLFDHQFPQEIIFAEKNKFLNISEIENQRIVLHSNSNSTIVSAFLESNNKLIVVKVFYVNSQETLIKKMDEYKIHHKVNKFYPQQSIQLILPVRIQKHEQLDMGSCIEKAEINLYDYSQTKKISEEEAIAIFQQILQQIINLHKINIAHRDIKPQNVLYVKEKGWLLCDFGESLEYSDVDDIYDIRGTVYFLKTDIQKQMKIGQCQQNLLENDLYALVVSMIMIQQQHYIKNIEQEINEQTNESYHQILQITQLKELINLQQNLLTKPLDFPLLIQKQILKENEFNRIEFKQENDLYRFYKKSQSFLAAQIIQLIRTNLEQLLCYNGFAYDLHGIQLLCLPSKQQIKNVQRSSIHFQQFCQYALFLQGYSEKTIFISTEILNNNYSQVVHFVLIDSYQRALMFKKAEEQFKKFIDGLLFDFLNSQVQLKFFEYLMYYQNKSPNVKIYMDFKIEEQLYQRGNTKIDIITQLDKKCEEYKDNFYKNKELVVNHLIQPFSSVNSYFNVLQLESLMNVIIYVIRQYPLYILFGVLKGIQETNCITFDNNNKISLCFGAAEVLIILNKSFKQQFKILKQYIFQAESWQQAIIVKIAYLIIQIQQYLSSKKQCQKYIDDLIERLFIALKSIKFITFDCYKQYIVQYILHFLKIMCKYEIKFKNSKLLNIIQMSIMYAFINHFQNTNYEMFKFYHMQAQAIILQLRNIKRCQAMIANYQQFLTVKAIKVDSENLLSVLLKISIKKILSIKVFEGNELTTVQQEAAKQFLFNRYLN